MLHSCWDGDDTVVTNEQSGAVNMSTDFITPFDTLTMNATSTEHSAFKELKFHGRQGELRVTKF